MPKTPCIFCRSETSPRTREHIIPESLGCPIGLVLEHGEVCGRCNNLLSVVDGRLQDALAPLKALLVRRTKKGKPPQINLSNARFEHTPTGPHLTINTSAHDKLVLADGRVLRPATDKAALRVARVRHLPDGQVSLSLTWQPPFGESFSRGLHKIAFEYFAFLRGAHEVLASHFDELRRYIIRGEQHRHVLLPPQPPVAFEEMRNELGAIFDFQDQAPGCVVPITLAGAHFLVCVFRDDYEALVLGQMLNTLHGGEGFHTLDAAGVVRTPDYQGRNLGNVAPA